MNFGSDLERLRVPTLSTLSKYPALSVGLTLFTFILLILDFITLHALSHTLSLYPYAPLKFDLNRLSFYCVVHQGLLHWLFNAVGLFPLISMFERTHGTVYTGITLNLLAVTAGLQYCIVGLLLYPNTHIIGISGIIFLFISYFAYKEYQFRPYIYSFQLSGREVKIPTLYSPFAALIICKILIPSSSFFGHLAGISSGFLLGHGYLRILYPPSKVILYIESKVSRGILSLEGLVTYYPETEAINTRGVSYNPILSLDAESALGNQPTTIL
ncbi:uncharacterized protein PRCAT00003724001 [Priceomyces carsonii]|uniref:uncharacterized protein n=1 Tax=Priceomyces carsonii TaxID=28549 RepID=UPI002ED8FA75|nr:unnamed protein product [Priceomyces carsonii]